MSKKKESKIKYRSCSDIIDICHHGVYDMGLCDTEIMSYLNKIAVALDIKDHSKLSEKFNKIAGINTVSGITTPCCNQQVTLMYRHDVERFANRLFFKTPTYWD